MDVDDDDVVAVEVRRGNDPTVSTTNNSITSAEGINRAENQSLADTKEFQVLDVSAGGVQGVERDLTDDQLMSAIE